MDYGVNQSKNQTDWTAGAGSLSNPFDPPVFLEPCVGQALRLMTCSKSKKLGVGTIFPVVSTVNE